MEKLASQMLDKAKQFIENNPQIVKSTLLAGGLGAVGGAMLPTPGEDEDEPATKRVKRRLRNALLGGVVAGGAGALLNNAAYNFGTAKLQHQPTPEEKWNAIQNSTADTIAHPATLAIGAGAGALVGGVKDYNHHQDLANKIIDGMKEQGKTAIDEHNKVVSGLRGSISKLEENLLKLNTARVGVTDQIELDKLDEQIDLARDAMNAKTDKLTKELEKIKKISVPTGSTGTRGLRRLLYENGGDETTELLAKALGVNKNTLVDSKPAVAKALREMNISAVKSGVQVNGGKLARVGRNILPRIRGNWRTLLGAAAVPTVLGVSGAVMDPN